MEQDRGETEGGQGEHRSYHDVEIFVDGQRYRIHENYAYELTCTRVGGWRLWYIWEGASKLIGGEYDSEAFRIEVGGIVICGRVEPDQHVEDRTP